ncbi:hypothetical protein EMPS_08503 [Entomortierella parvispora]|uniref:Arm-like repeat domain-containing protein n=1 Tax=Entomortierella parvispora TaxID=205924 RepID=A0A9P3HG48_9FUNG|nr:hypothetical protein EMPS_08503 [Entomortierella parvispora]
MAPAPNYVFSTQGPFPIISSSSSYTKDERGSGSHHSSVASLSGTPGTARINAPNPLEHIAQSNSIRGNQTISSQEVVPIGPNSKAPTVIPTTSNVSHYISGLATSISDTSHFTVGASQELKQSSNSTTRTTAAIFQNPGITDATSSQKLQYHPSATLPSAGADPSVDRRKPITIPVPGDDELIEDTIQLFYCARLLEKGRSHSRLLSPALSTKPSHTIHSDDQDEWIRYIGDNPLEKEHLYNLMSRMARKFVTLSTRDPASIQEVVLIGPFLIKDYHHELARIFLQEFQRKTALDANILLGLVQLIREAPSDSFMFDDLARILGPIRKRLEATAGRDAEYTVYLIHAVTVLLTAMGACSTKDQGFEECEPLFRIFSALQKHKYPPVKFQAKYAKKVMISIFSRGVMENDANFAQTANWPQKLMRMVRRSFSRNQWFQDVQQAMGFVRNHLLSDLYKLVHKGSSTGNINFKWHICQLLGEIAVDPTWNDDDHHKALTLLYEYANINGSVRHDPVIRRWALTILRHVTEFPLTSIPVGIYDPQAIYEKAFRERKQSFVCGFKERGVEPFKIAHPVMSRLSLPSTSPLLHKVNSDPDVELAINRLHRQRYRVYNRREIYIQLLSKPNIRASEDVLVELQERTREFLGGKSEVLLVLGDSGAGKSTFGLHLENELWAEYEPGGPIPLFIDLKTIEASDKDMIHQYLEDLGFFTDQQIESMQRSRRFILICDGYDECHKWTNLHTKNRFNRPRQWQAKMIVTCRTQYLGPNYRNYFEPESAPSTSPNFAYESDIFEEAVIVPFRATQIKEYVELFNKMPKTVENPAMEQEWSIEWYMERLKRITHLMEMAKNPFMLKMIVDVLPRIPKNTTKLTRVELYDHFVDLHFESEHRRLLNQQSSGKMDNGTLSAFTQFRNNEFISLGLNFSKQLSRCIFKEQQGINSVTYSTVQDRGTWKETFFGFSARARLLQESTQLVCRENRQDIRQLIRHKIRTARKRNSYEFSHRSIMEYFYSCLIFDPRGNAPQLDLAACLDSADGPIPVVNHPLGQTSIVSESSILHFLAERIYQSEEFYIQLQRILQLSKVEATFRRAASNSITILVRAGVRFNGNDLRGIQIPGADLSEGKFDSAQLQGANLIDVCLKSAWLRQVDLSGAIMTNVLLGENTYSEVPDLWSSAISSDGMMLVAGLETGDVQIYDLTDFCLRHTFRGHSRIVRSVDFSNDCSLVASGSDDGAVRVWNLKGRKNCAFLGHSCPVYCVAFAPDSERLASAGDDGTTRIWDIESESCVLTLETDFAMEMAVVNELTVSWSPCGRQIATGAALSRELVLWNAETGEIERTLEADGEDMVVYSRQGKLLAIGSRAELIDLASDTETNKPVVINCGTTAARAIFSQDEQTIVLACVNGSIQFWDGISGSYIACLNGHTSVVVGIAILGDQRLVSASRDGTVRFWQLDDELGSKEKSFNLPSPHRRGHTFDARYLVYSPSGEYLLSTSDESWVLLWDAASGTCRQFLELDRGPKMMSLSPNGRRLAVASRVYQLDYTEGRKEDSRFDNLADKAVFSPCGRWMASWDYGRVLKLWDLLSEDDPARLLEGFPARVTKLKFSPSGCQLISLSGNGTIILWDTERAEKIENLKISGSNFSFSPCGNVLVILDGISVYLWDLQERRGALLVAELEGIANCVEWSPCGSWIAMGHEDRTVRLWRMSDGGSGPVRSEEIVILDIFSPVSCLTWSPTDPLEFAIGCFDGSVFVWRVAEVQGSFRVELVWDSSASRLTVTGARIDHVSGLKSMQRNMLMQRGAIDESNVVDYEPASPI